MFILIHLITVIIQQGNKYYSTTEISNKNTEKNKISSLHDTHKIFIQIMNIYYD